MRVTAWLLGRLNAGARSTTGPADSGANVHFLNSRPAMNPGRPAMLFAALMIAACSTQSVAPDASSDSSHFERDHQAILAMAGDYKVDFAFDETVVLKAGYTPHAAYRSTGHEFVAVLEDSGTRVSLQHVLVGDSGEVTKHWRQDWQYQQTRLWEFVGDNVWQRRELPAAAVQGQWTQTVWQVDDSPRYAGMGRWSHQDGVSSWTSEPAWRPLPRRELTTRSDYDKLVGINRQTITPGGWVHEQDNLKIDRKAAAGEQALVREKGVDTYTRVTGYDFSAGHAYWSRTQDYWATVRAVWTDLFARNARIELRKKADDKLLYEALFEQADALGGTGMTVSQMRVAIDGALQSFVLDGRLAAVAASSAGVSASSSAGAR